MSDTIATPGKFEGQPVWLPTLHSYTEDSSEVSAVGDWYGLHVLNSDDPTCAPGQWTDEDNNPLPPGDPRIPPYGVHLVRESDSGFVTLIASGREALDIFTHITYGG